MEEIAWNTLLHLSIHWGFSIMGNGLGISLSVATTSADLGGSNKYSNEGLE
jgi:hypothetical protein